MGMSAIIEKAYPEDKCLKESVSKLGLGLATVVATRMLLHSNAWARRVAVGLAGTELAGRIYVGGRRRDSLKDKIVAQERNICTYVQQITNLTTAREESMAAQNVAEAARRTDAATHRDEIQRAQDVVPQATQDQLKELREQLAEKQRLVTVAEERKETAIRDLEQSVKTHQGVVTSLNHKIAQLKNKLADEGATTPLPKVRPGEKPDGAQTPPTAKVDLEQKKGELSVPGGDDGGGPDTED